MRDVVAEQVAAFANADGGDLVLGAEDEGDPTGHSYREFLKNADYRALFEVPRYRAVNELQRLVDDGYLTREGEKRGARYRPGPRLRVGRPE